jgi:hypothetical protein
MLFSNTPSPLGVGPHGAERREGRRDLDPALREELGEVRLGREHEHGQVAPVRDPPAELDAFVDEEAELRAELRGAACDVQGRQVVVAAEQLDHLLGCLPCHRLPPVGAGIHVTVRAGLVAELSHVDLQHFDSGGREGR